MMLSVVIPSHNGGQKLIQCLKALSNQTTDAFTVLLIDSCSTDDSISRASEYWRTRKPAIKMKVFRERQPGAQYARLRGARECDTDLIVFCDDDNLLRPDYLANARKLACGRPDVGFIGGFGVGVPEQGAVLPDWFDSIKTFFAAPGVPSEPVTMKPIIGTYTAGMVARKCVFDAFEKTEFQPILSGRVGRSLVAGEDIEMCKAASLLGYTICQDSSLVFDHIMTSGRLNKAYARKLCYAMGVARCRHRAYDYVSGASAPEERTRAWQREVSLNWKPFVRAAFSLLQTSSIDKADARVQVSYFRTLLRERQQFGMRLEQVARLADRKAHLQTNGLKIT